MTLKQKFAKDLDRMLFIGHLLADCRYIASISPQGKVGVAITWPSITVEDGELYPKRH